MVIKRYPYQLWAQTFSGEAIKGGTGRYTASSSGLAQLCPCRDEVNGSGQQIKLDDSSTVLFDWLIQAPTYLPALSVGTSIEVRDGVTVRLKGNVLRVQRDQLHCRIWVSSQ